jgi:hypothetical protein
MILIRNKLVLRYINEIQKLLMKIRNIKLKKSEIVLEALQYYFTSLLQEILSNEVKKEELVNYVEDKELLKRHIII